MKMLDELSEMSIACKAVAMRYDPMLVEICSKSVQLTATAFVRCVAELGCPVECVWNHRTQTYHGSFFYHGVEFSACGPGLKELSKTHPVKVV